RQLTHSHRPRLQVPDRWRNAWQALKIARRQSPNSTQSAALTDGPPPGALVRPDTYSRSYYLRNWRAGCRRADTNDATLWWFLHVQPSSGEREARVEYDFDGGVCGSPRISTLRR